MGFVSGPRGGDLARVRSGGPSASLSAGTGAACSNAVVAPHRAIPRPSGSSPATRACGHVLSTGSQRLCHVHRHDGLASPAPRHPACLVRLGHSGG